MTLQEINVRQALVVDRLVPEIYRTELKAALAQVIDFAACYKITGNLTIDDEMEQRLVATNPRLAGDGSFDRLIADQPEDQKPGLVQAEDPRLGEAVRIVAESQHDRAVHARLDETDRPPRDPNLSGESQGSDPHYG